MLKNKNFFLFGSVIFIILAIPLVSLLSRTGSSSNSGDVRARAGIATALRMNGTVNSVDETNSTLIIDNVYLADESRSGDTKSLGAWTVAAPSGFNFASVSPGQIVSIGIDAKTFFAQSHTVSALTITPVK